MLHEVSRTTNTLSERIIHNHPNSMGCQLFRKRVTRANPDELGGLGTLSDEDEEQIEYDFLGPGSALPSAEDAGQPLVLSDNQDVGFGEEQYRFLIAPEAPSGDPEWFSVEKADVMLLWLDTDEDDDQGEPIFIKIPFEVVAVETINNLPPFSVRYVCNRRDDLTWAMNDLDDPTPPDDAAQT